MNSAITGLVTETMATTTCHPGQTFGSPKIQEFSTLHHSRDDVS